MAKANELLDVPKRGKSHIESLLSAPSSTKVTKKPRITKIQAETDITSKLRAFLPGLKAANEALPQDDSVNIENVDDAEPYIEMDLGLGVLEEKDESDGDDAIQTLLTKSKNAPIIVDMSSDLPDSLLTCDPSLKIYRSRCQLDELPKLDIILSLMSRILAQLRRRHTKVDKITKLNVLQEDMYKLMRRRDEILQDDLVHETKYLDELDRLLAT